MGNFVTLLILFSAFFGCKSTPEEGSLKGFFAGSEKRTDLTFHVNPKRTNTLIWKEDTFVASDNTLEAYSCFYTAQFRSHTPLGNFSDKKILKKGVKHLELAGFSNTPDWKKKIFKAIKKYPEARQKLEGLMASGPYPLNNRVIKSVEKVMDKESSPMLTDKEIWTFLGGTANKKRTASSQLLLQLSE